MFSSSKLKSIDFYRKIPRDLTEASLSGAGLSIIAALAMVFLFGMEVSSYLSVATTTTVVVDRSKNGEHLRIDFNVSFPRLSCEFLSVDVHDVLGTVRQNITKTLRKYPIDTNLKLVGEDAHVGHLPRITNHGDELGDGELGVSAGEGPVELNAENFERYSHEFPVLLVNYYAPWCVWSQRLKPSWDKTAQIIHERYNPEDDGRILIAKVDCAEARNAMLCRSHHIQGYPSIRIFRKGQDIRDAYGRYEHESYYGERDTDSLVDFAEKLIQATTGSDTPALEDKSSVDNSTVKRPAPKSGGCRVEGFALVKKVPGSIVMAARSTSHSFDASKINMSHYVHSFSFGRKLSYRMAKEVYRLHPLLDNIQESLSGHMYNSPHENVTFDHYLQAVKTEVVSLKSSKDFKLLEEYNYVAHSAELQTEEVPVAKFQYELSPMQVLVSETPKSFSHFLTNLCAIIGGVFTVAGIIDSMLHNAIRMVKKVELGKQY
ncbi:hypothetical protein R1sor_002727 [Riccia sorocarpa]|uniref:Thioredoxin domain-containing protein n=1 Tax=Riccia sorocarpa TaxID=122646 RepID=A0ABD3GZK2_9MARC